MLARGIDHAVEFSGELYAHDGHIDYLVDVATAANKANAPLSLAVELAPTRWNFDIEEYPQVLAAAMR